MGTEQLINLFNVDPCGLGVPLWHGVACGPLLQEFHALMAHVPFSDAKKSLSNSNGRHKALTPYSIHDAFVPIEQFQASSSLPLFARRLSTPRPNERRGQDNEGCNAPRCQPTRSSSYDVRTSIITEGYFLANIGLPSSRISNLARWPLTIC